MSTSADQLVQRLQALINASTSLTTENTNVVQAGKDVLVEQLSTITRDGRVHVRMVCHILTVEDGRIAAIRAYCNDDGEPAGWLAPHLVGGPAWATLGPRVGSDGGPRCFSMKAATPG